MTTVRIVAMSINTHELIMYKDDGEVINIRQGDPRIKSITEKLVPAIKASGYCLLTESDFAIENEFNEAEKQLNGAVKFFRVLKGKFKEIIDKFSAPIEPMELGDIPDSVNEAPIGVSQETDETFDMRAVNEIIENSVPSGSGSFMEKDKPSQETTIVAITENGAVIPGMEQISVQMQALANKLGSVEGVINFFTRISKVKRAHSVQDLLKFMQKGELPIADDGSILVYKRLQKTPIEGVYADCHTGNVRQRVGSFVHMDEKLVDSNRRKDCSNGLHVARRDYLQSFSGNVCVLAKLAPEDVIAVPEYDARKLRASGYHIINLLSQEDFNEVTSNRPMKDKVMLGNAISGNHVGILEYVEITEQKGGGLKITRTDLKEREIVDNGHRAESLDSIPEKLEKHPSVDPLQVAKEKVEPKDPEPAEVKVSILGKLLHDLKVAKSKTEKVLAAEALQAHKKQARKSWSSLGVSPQQVAEIHGFLEIGTPQEVPAKADPVEKKKTAPKKKAAKPAPKVEKMENTKQLTRTKPEQAQYLWGLFEKNPDRPNAQALVTFKQQAKKSWTYLGLTDAQGKRVVNRIK